MSEGKRIQWSTTHYAKIKRPKNTI